MMYQLSSIKIPVSHNIEVNMQAGMREIGNDYSISRLSYSTTFNDKTKLYNLIANAGYNFNQRYYFKATSIIERTRLTNSEKESLELNRTKFYPSISVGWDVSNEAFLKDNKIISNLFMRTGYGIRGNGNADYLVFNAALPGIEQLKTLFAKNKLY